MAVMPTISNKLDNCWTTLAKSGNKAQFTRQEFDSGSDKRCDIGDERGMAARRAYERRRSISRVRILVSSVG